MSFAKIAQQLADKAPAQAAEAKPRAIPRSFQAFCELAEVTLRPGQLELARVAFDGERPATESKVWGFQGKPPNAACKVVVAVCGRGSGKSLAILALRAVHLGLIVDVSKLRKRELAEIPIVAPDKPTARVTMRYAVGIVETVLGPKAITDQTADSFSFKRHDCDRTVRFSVLAASAGGKSVRGRSMPCAIMDEAAFFRDLNNVVNDSDIFAALMPRMMPGSQLLLASTPWTEKGLLWEAWRDNYRSPQTCLVAHAPTTVMRDDPDAAAMVSAERSRDPVNARREYDAEFLPRDASSFFDNRAISDSIDPLLVIPAPRRDRVEYFAAGDFGFSRDSSALAVVEREGDKVRVVCLREAVPTEAPLVPSEVTKEFAEDVNRYGAHGLCADSHYREAIREHLEAAGLTLMSAPEGAAGKSSSYAVAKTLLQQGRVKLPNHPRLLQQLRDVAVRPTAAGGISIQSPRVKGGGHGDLVSALVLALWQSQRNYTPFTETPESNMDEQEKREVERFAEEQERLQAFEVEIPEWLL